MKTNYLIRKLSLTGLSVCIGMLLSASMYAATRTFTGTGDFSTVTLWDGGTTLPAADDDVIVAPGSTMTIDGNYTLASFTIAQGTETAMQSLVTIAGSNTLTVNGQVTINYPYNSGTRNNELNVADGTLICNNLNINSIGYNTRGVLRLKDGSITLTEGAFTANTGNNTKQILLDGSGTLTINVPEGWTWSGDCFSNANVHVTANAASTVIINGADARIGATSSGRRTFGNLTINCPTTTLSATQPIIVNGTFTLNSTLTLLPIASAATTAITLNGPITTDAPEGFGADRSIVMNLVNSSNPQPAVTVSRTSVDGYIGIYPITVSGFYNPLTITGVSSVNPLTFRINEGKVLLNTNPNSLARSLTLSSTAAGNDVSGYFSYLPSDVTGDESRYVAGSILSTGGPASSWSTAGLSVNETEHRVYLTAFPANADKQLVTAAETSFTAPNWANVVYSINTNAWNSDAGWSTGVVPTAAQDVYLLHSKSLTNGSTQYAKNLYVNSGTNLSLTAANTKLEIDGDLYVAGRFTTNADPAGVTVANNIIVEGGVFNSTLNTAAKFLTVGGELIENNGGYFSSSRTKLTALAVVVKGSTLSLGNLNLATDGMTLTNEAEELTIAHFTTNAATFSNKGLTTITGFITADEKASQSYDAQTVTFDCSYPGNTVIHRYGLNQSPHFVPYGTFWNLTIWDTSTNGRQRNFIGKTVVLNDLEAKKEVNNAFGLHSSTGADITVGNDFILNGPVQFRASSGTVPLKIGNEIRFINNDFTAKASITTIYSGTANCLNITMTKDEGTLISGTDAGFYLHAGSLTLSGTGDKKVDLPGDSGFTFGSSTSADAAPMLTNAAGTLTFTQDTVFINQRITANLGGEGLIKFNHLQLGPKTTAIATNRNSRLNIASNFVVDGDLLIRARTGAGNNLITLDGKTLTLNGDVKIKEGEFSFVASNNPSFIINGTGALSTPVRFSGTPVLQHLTLNRAGADGGIELASAGSVLTVDSLTMTAGALIPNDKLAYAAADAVLTYNGTAEQTQGAEWTSAFAPANIVVENTSAEGVKLAANTDFAGALKLNGILNADNKTLKLEQAPTRTSGMVDLAAGGELQIKEAASITFPVGTGVDYTPVDAAVASPGTGYIGVKATPEKHAEISSYASSYLKRYWELTGYSTTGTASFDLTYVDGDISGTETSMSGAKYDTGWTLPIGMVDATNNKLTGISGFGVFTGFRPTFVWTGNTDEAWTVGSNWSSELGSSVPSTTDDVVIPASPTGNRYPALSANEEVSILTMDFGAMVTGTGKLTTGKTKVNYTIPPKKWDAIGFPFASSNFSCLYEGVIPSDWTNNALEPARHFWLRSYDGANNLFTDVTDLSAGEGYIVQFPTTYGTESKYTAVFESTGGYEFDPANSISIPANGEYKLVSNPTLNEYTATSGTSNLYYYKYNGTNSFRRVADNEQISVAPFESFVVANTSTPASLRSLLHTEGENGATSIEPAAESNDPIVETRYYTLQGMAVNEPSDNGTYLVKELRESGKVTTRKVFNVKND